MSEFSPAPGAHDEKPDGVDESVRANGRFTGRYRVFATGMAGRPIRQACPGRYVQRCKCGPPGGEKEGGALIATGAADLVIFFAHPLTPMPTGADIKALMRPAAVCDIPVAVDRASAVFMPAAAIGDDISGSADRAKI